MWLADGSKIGLTFVSADDTSDHCWLVTTLPQKGIPYALLATADPKPGDTIWHCGFGTDKPGNLERGTVIAGTDGNGQCRYSLSVSHGDSGGGIALDTSGRVLSPVCCTTRTDAVGDVWGCSPLVAAKRLAQGWEVSGEWHPIEVPMRMP